MTYWRSVVLVFLGACSYGVLATMVKLGYAMGFTTGEISGSQMVMGALILWVLTVFFSGIRKVSRKNWLSLIGAGFFAGLTGIFYYSSLRYVPASIGIVLLFQFTWMGVLIESVLERKWPSLPRIFSLVLLAIGTVLAGRVWDAGFSGLPIKGIILGLLAGLTYASFVLSSGRVASAIDPWMRSSIMMTGSALITVLVFPPVFLINGSLFEGLLFWGFLLALFGAILPTLFFTYGVPHIGGGLATILGSAELPMAVVMATVVLNEQVTPLQWLGVVTILIGISVAEIRQGEGRKKAEQPLS
ncbi:MAG: DMT family transporter [Bacillaceae bacterium]|nr:DMT family transporter [Bacillaceae bacterium]